MIANAEDTTRRVFPSDRNLEIVFMACLAAKNSALLVSQLET